MVTNNSINLKSPGIAGYDGAGTFVGTPVTSHNVLVGGGTSDTLINVAPSATVGFVLTSNGSSADPSFQSVSPGASVTFTGDTGTPFSTSTVTIYTDNSANTCGSSVLFDASTPNMSFIDTDQNSNVLIGNTCGNATVSGVTGGTGNVGLGSACLSSINTGNNNTSIGAISGISITSGSGNVLVGNSAGQSYTSGESFNVVIGVNAATAGESNVLRIGGGTGTGAYQQNLAFVSGISGTTPIDTNSPKVVVCDSTDNITVIPDTTPGYVLTSNFPNSPTFQVLPAATFPWTNEGANFNLVAGNGYFCNTTLTATLPASPSQGDTVEIIVLNNAITTIQANTGQTIRLGTTVSASAGTAANIQNGCSITLVYRTNSTQWYASSVIGNWNIV